MTGDGRPVGAEPKASGRVIAAAGPVIRATGLPAISLGDVVRVGPARLLGEVIHLDRDEVTLQVYEETAGIAVGDPVEATGGPLSAWLGPGLLGSILDGLQRPLDRLAAAGTWMLRPGAAGTTSEGPIGTLGDRTWRFAARCRPDEEVGPGDIVGYVAEGPLEHRILVPPGVTGRLVALENGDYQVDADIGSVATSTGDVALRLAHAWPVRRPRPVARRLAPDRPLVTGQRVIDLLYPLARGGTAVIPGGFGTGKTVVEQQLARWADAEVVVYVGCGERGNEIAELLATFPELSDPRTGRPLIERTTLIANTSNMPVAAREASVQLGMTIAEYYRDQGRAVALLADSTSRWAEALREISGRLEELPGEEGFPAYLASRLAAFYERAGSVGAIGSPEREGSITLVGAVSPPGGDFSEPVTQASLRLAGTFWALDTGLAHARHFPAIGWTQSYSLYVDQLAPWMAQAVGGPWSDSRSVAIELLAREKTLLDVVALVGADALPDRDRGLLEVARLLREVVLQQHAFDPIDAARPLDVQFALLEAVLAARTGILAGLERGAGLEALVRAPELAELRAAKRWTEPGLVERLSDLAVRLARLQPVADLAPLADASALGTGGGGARAVEPDEAEAVR